MRLFSDDLKQGEEIPLVFAEPGAGGRNILPQLGWDEVPAEAKSLALTCWDPDAPLEGGFWHWLALDIPVSTTGTVQGTPLPAGSVELQNDYGYRGYGGPNPPHGQVHRYIFTVWALDVAHLDVPADAKPAAVEELLKAHALASATLTPVFTSTI
ncbi:YbhB/YbcL family Raf kinase inhibitor-like protein [Propionibacterium freudenreichii]|uniref:YbhB/YbcL family Raf kinase inhibitor-like protein n=2 Tax=Propionibacterium freudenreichii TaxID=1744 RepID=UPI000BC345B8|nr:YbhB/YbcL family Raf kinase inhibitor-like protein [Propionibacterium freudenreichii]MDK9353603.1 YbhB/YbcL family Raf kinase inhibitor-like protein [Propionibacterium freudenreichii]MDK9646979.1 YbhB/YbcL family Raf kinase inhibitor-like protein [Propionibacterium freudenreichii]MDK9655193.1 YbhB/YbcL family Raf kinase inhibitor-like protein [Propionibacterium freudenreichii]MDK9667440.1 YbhB/YbcL family Raf kinase inhibitor-like protein [Propionibacterium freudenreichii]SBN43161.1 UPF0098